MTITTTRHEQSLRLEINECTVTAGGEPTEFPERFVEEVRLANEILHASDFAAYAEESADWAELQTGVAGEFLD